MTPQQLTSRLNEAIAHHNAGRFDRAESIYSQLAPLAPNSPMLFQLRGQTAEQQGRIEDAIQYYSRACRLDPAAVTTAVRLSGALIALGRVDDAGEVMAAMTRKSPGNPEAWNGLGFVFKLKARLPEAVACHEKAVALNPRYVAGLCHLGLTLGSMGRNSEAVAQFERALAIEPGSTLARYGRAQTLHKVYRLEESVAEYEAVLRATPQNIDARSYRLFVLEHLESVTPEQLFLEHRAYGRAVGSARADYSGHDFSPERRLRVGIVSPDLRNHSCAYFLEPLLTHLDREQFELFLYHDHFVDDATSARLRKLCSAWRHIVGQSHESVERLLRADKLDVAIDLAGHVGNSIRLPVFARRIAPVQITYLGYPDTTGVPAMDFRLTDPVADPAGEADAFATEKLVRFSSVAWAYQAPAETPDVAPLPCASSAGIVFGCFNNPTKFSETLYRSWAEILRRVPGSKLLLKGRDLEEPTVRALLDERMRSAGVPLERVEWIPRTRGTREHLEQYFRVDIALDTFPYNGTTTTCEALWMGRPVVTLAGNRHAARVGASLLTAIGHPELVAATTDEYVGTAVALASTPDALAAVSARLRADMGNSALCDHAAQSSRFAAALRACWRGRCATAAQVSSAQSETLIVQTP